MRGITAFALNNSRTVVMTILLGVYPSLVTDIIGPSVEALLGSYDTAVAEHAAISMVASNGGSH